MEAILLILSKHCLRSKAVLNLKLWNSLLDWASLKLTERQVFCILNSVPLHFEKVPVFSGLTCKLPWRSLNILLPSKSSVSFKTAQRKQSKPSPLYLHLKKKKKICLFSYCLPKILYSRYYVRFCGHYKNRWDNDLGPQLLRA